MTRRSLFKRALVAPLAAALPAAAAAPAFIVTPLLRPTGEFQRLIEMLMRDISIGTGCVMQCSHCLEYDVEPAIMAGDMVWQCQNCGRYRPFRRPCATHGLTVSSDFSSLPSGPPCSREIRAAAVFSMD